MGRRTVLNWRRNFIHFIKQLKLLNLKKIRNLSQYSILNTQYSKSNSTDNNKKLLEDFPKKVKMYKKDFYEFKVREKILKIQTFTESLSRKTNSESCFSEI